MVIYLPISFIKDLIYNYLKKRKSKQSGNPGLESPLKYIAGHAIFEIEQDPVLNKKNSDMNLSSQDEVLPLVSKLPDNAIIIRHEKEVTAKEIAAYGFYIAPLWFITEVILFLQQIMHKSKYKA